MGGGGHLYWISFKNAPARQGQDFLVGHHQI